MPKPPSPTSIIDITPPLLTQVAVSSASLYASQSTTLTFTSGESGTYRVLECTSGCGGVTPTYVTLSSGSMTATVQKSITYPASAFSAGSGVKTLAIELIDGLLNPIIHTSASTPAVPTVTISSALISSISVSPTTVNDGSNFAVGFTSNQTGTYRILECTATCSTVTSIASGSMTAATPVSHSIDPATLSAGSGSKTLAIELTDIINNSSTYTNATTPAVSAIYRNAAPTNNVTNFKILKYKNGATPTFKLSWTLPGTITSGDLVRIRKGTTTVPTSCTDGAQVADKLYTDTYHNIAVGADTANNVSYAAFVFNSAAGVCVVSAGTSYGSLWTLVPTVTVSSLGSTAQYVVSASLNNVSLQTAESRTNVKSSAWTGTNEASVCISTGVGCGIDANIANMSYFGVTSNSLTTANATTTLTYDYSNNTQHPAWAKRYHRFYFSNSDATNSELSDVYPFGKPPTGMVYVPATSWPQNVSVSGASSALTESYPTTASIGDWDIIPHDFAIDTYEASLGSGSFGTPTTFPNSDTGVLVSANVAPLGSKNWYSFKQGCLNRSYDALYSSAAATADLPSGTGANQSQNSATIINNPRRKYHLTSGVEWIVGAYGTPDQGTQGYCNIDARGAPASPAATGTNDNSLCISAFGARNMIGNDWEWSDDWAKDGKFGGITKWNSTTAEGMSAIPPPNSANKKWNFRSNSYLLASLNVTVNSDNHWSLNEDGGTIEGGTGGGRGFAVMRSGDYGSTSSSGRFAFNIGGSPLNTAINLGSRCAIIAPKVQPSVARFAIESIATTTKLAWVTLDTEDSTVITLASAPSKAEIDAFDGVNAATNVTINTISLDTPTGKHIGAGGCEGSYTPKAAGFEGEVNNSTRQDNYYSGKYCISATGTKYYKLCATNPSIAHVSDEYTSLQRTTCSAVVAVIASQALPTFSAYSNAANLQNDSDGAFARFYWNASGGTNMIAKLVYGVSIDQVKRYNGDTDAFSAFDTGSIASGVYYGTLSGIKTVDITAGATRAGGGGTTDCDTAEYNGSTYGVYEPFTGANGVTVSHFACVNMSAYPKWTKMFFKVMLANTDGAGNITSGWVQSEIRGAGHVPTGMTYVTREEWNSIKNSGEDYTAWVNCVGAPGVYPTLNHIQYMMPGVTNYRHGTTGCVYDYAVDKYEIYNANAGSIGNQTFNATNTGEADHNTSSNNTAPGTAQSTMAANTSTAILRSTKGQTSIGNAMTAVNWFSIKKGCANRTAEIITQGFLPASPSPTNYVRLATGVEWVTAVYNTPDNAAGVAVTASNGNSLCNVNSSTFANSWSVQNSTSWGGAFAGTGGMPKCVSAFGTYDQIGGANEFSDEVTVGSAKASSANWYHLVGTSQATAFPASGTGSIPSVLLNETANNWVSTWDYITGTPSANSATANTSYITSTGGPYGNYGEGGWTWNPAANWVLARGGQGFLSFGGEKLGRFHVDRRASPVAKWMWSTDFNTHNSPPYGSNYLQGGGRCVVSPP